MKSRELPDGLNPHYVESLLKKPTDELLETFVIKLQDTIPQVQETIGHFHTQNSMGQQKSKTTYQFGLRILTSSLFTIGLVLEELKEREKTIDGSLNATGKTFVLNDK